MTESHGEAFQEQVGASTLNAFLAQDVYAWRINNALSLISPWTGDMNAGGNDLTALDELALSDASANASAAGRLRRNSTALTWHDGTAARTVLNSASTSAALTTLSSLTTVGTIGTGTWQGTAVATQYGGTGQNFSATAQGNTLYFSAAGTVSALSPGTSSVSR